MTRISGDLVVVKIQSTLTVWLFTAANTITTTVRTSAAPRCLVRAGFSRGGWTGLELLKVTS